MRKKQMLRAVQSLILAVVVIFGAVIVSCKEDADTPQDWSAENLAITHGSAKVIGKGLTSTEWEKSKTDLIKAIEDGYSKDAGAVGALFGQSGGVTITVEKSPSEYTNWKATDLKTLNIKYASISTIDIAQVVDKILSDGPTQGSAIPPQDADTHRLASVNADTPAVTKGANS